MTADDLVLGAIAFAARCGDYALRDALTALREHDAAVTAELRAALEAGDRLAVIEAMIRGGATVEAIAVTLGVDIS